MKKTGFSDLPLHGGRVPLWLADRMKLLGGAIIEAIVSDYGRDEVIRRLADPLWFQSLGCVMGMDWHSSGITTSVMGSLKKAINPISHELGIFVCGGRGRHSRKTPAELVEIANNTGLDGNKLVRSSKLSAKVDNSAVQDGFQLYLHSFVLTVEGKWTVIQQGMNGNAGMARRYHWQSGDLKSFVDEPHSGITGENQGLILNLTHREANHTREAIFSLSRENPGKIVPEIRKILMPKHHEVRVTDVNLKRLGSVLALAHDSTNADFEEFLLTPGLGPRTLQTLTLVSEVIHGTPSRFSDPARFSFALGGKDGHPFPVPLKVYDETIIFLNDAIQKAKLDRTEKLKSLQRLHAAAKRIEGRFRADGTKFSEYLEREHSDSPKYGGRTVMDNQQPGSQLKLFSIQKEKEGE